MLRPYQQDSVEAMVSDLIVPGNSIVCLPTGGGKSWVIAEFADLLSTPILILAPSKELVEQDIDKLIKCGVSKNDIGIFTASLKSKTIKKFTFAIVNSAYRKPELFRDFKIVIVDECDKINTKDNRTMYRELFTKMGNPKVYGLTATPYRNATQTTYSSGYLTTKTKLMVLSREDGFWDRIIYNQDNADLTPEYLCPLKYETNPIVDQYKIPMLSNLSDYDQEKYSKQIEPLRYKVVEATINAKSRFRSILVFCPSIQMADELHQIFTGSGLITGKTKPKERQEILDNFRNGTLQLVFNVEVLTTGFDHPSLDCIVLLRPTKSIRLYYQILGRGVRQAPGKEYCTIIDLTGTTTLLGGIDKIRLKNIDDNWELMTQGRCWHGEVISSFIKRR